MIFRFILLLLFMCKTWRTNFLFDPLYERLVFALTSVSVGRIGISESFNFFLNNRNPIQFQELHPRFREQLIENPQ